MTASMDTLPVEQLKTITSQLLSSINNAEQLAVVVSNLVVMTPVTIEQKEALLQTVMEKVQESGEKGRAAVSTLKTVMRDITDDTKVCPPSFFSQNPVLQHSI